MECRQLDRGRKTISSRQIILSMRFPDPYALRTVVPKETVRFAASQLTGALPVQEDYFLNFNDECFVMADGVGSLSNGETAAKLACDTAIWAYKHIRQHRYYWLDKKLFMKRIFRSTNLAVWQKHREQGYEQGLATTLSVLMVGPKHFWLGSAGDSSVWLYHEGSITKLTRDKSEFQSIPSNALGTRRLGLVPEFMTGIFDPGDVLLMTTDGVGDYLTSGDIQASISASGDTNESLMHATTLAFTAAQTNGSDTNMTAIIVKRVSS